MGNMPSQAKHAVARTEAERAYYDLNARVYPKFARFYDIVASPASRIRRRVADLVGAKPDVKVVDLATGTGSQALAFARRGADVLGIDLSEEMLGRARKKGRDLRVTFRQGDATELPIEDGRFDVASVSFALHEMPASVRDRVLAEMARVTRPGGTVVVVDYRLPKLPIWRWLVYHVVKLYERDQYVDFVRRDRGDLPARLQRVGLEVTADRSALLGIARIIVGRKPV